MDIVQYSLVNWEQVKGDAPDIAAKATTERGKVLQPWLGGVRVCVYWLWEREEQVM